MFAQRRIQPQHFHGMVHARINFSFGQFLILRAEGDILFHGFLKQLVFGILKHKSHAAAHLGEIRFLIARIRAVYKYAAGRGMLQRVEVGNQRGFPAARMPDDADKFARFDVQIHPVQRARFKGRSGHIDMR